MSRDTLPKFNWKRALRNGLGYGLALELVAIGSGYYLYREYKTNEGKETHHRKRSNLKVNIRLLLLQIHIIHSIQRADGREISSFSWVFQLYVWLLYIGNAKAAERQVYRSGRR